MKYVRLELLSDTIQGLSIRSLTTIRVVEVVEAYLAFLDDARKVRQLCFDGNSQFTSRIVDLALASALMDQLRNLRNILEYLLCVAYL